MEPDLQLILIRHGETEWNRKRRYQGQKDVKLNARGREQAQLAARHLEKEDIDVIYSSDLSRAKDTAELIADKQGMQVRELEGLRELDFGAWEGKDYQTIIEKDENRYRDWLHNPGEVTPPDGEEMSHFQERVASTFSKIIECHSGKDDHEKIAAAAHGGTIRIYLVEILEIPLKRYTRLYFDNGGITRIDFYEGNPVITLVNDTHHLFRGE